MHKPIGWVVGVLALLAIAWLAYRLLAVSGDTASIRDGTLAPNTGVTPIGPAGNPETRP